MNPRALLLCLTACSALTLQIDEPRLCQSLPTIVIPPAKGGIASGGANFKIPLDLALDQSQDQQVSVQLIEADFTEVADGGAVNGLEGVKIVVVDPTSTAAPGIVALDYTRPSGTPASNPLEIPSSSPNLASYLQGGALDAQVQLTGTLPETEWSLAVQLCFKVSATLDYAEAATSSG